MFAKTLVAVSTLAATLFAASIACADEPAKPQPQPAASDKAASEAQGPEHKTAGKVQLQAIGSLTTAGVGLGAGLRVGYTVPQKVYLGAALKANIAGETDGSTVVSILFVRPMAEIGYDVSTGPVVIRPYAGLGAAIVRVDATNGDKSASATAGTFAGALGVSLLGEIPKTPMFLGADLSTFATASDVDLHPIDINLIVGARF